MDVFFKPNMSNSRNDRGRIVGGVDIGTKLIYESINFCGAGVKYTALPALSKIADSSMRRLPASTESVLRTRA